MKNLKLYALALVMCGACVSVETYTVSGIQPAGGTNPADVSVKMRMVARPPADALQRRVFVDFVDSPLMSKEIAVRLAAAGFKVVESEADSDVVLRLQGLYQVQPFAMKPKTGKLGPLLEGTLAKASASLSEYSHQSVSTPGTLAERAVTGAFSVTNLAMLVSQTIGINGWFNQLVAGDPRGFCVNEKCNQFRSYVALSTNFGASRWWGDAEVWEETIVVDRVIDHVLAANLAPLLAMETLPNAEQGEAKK